MIKSKHSACNLSFYGTNAHGSKKMDDIEILGNEKIVPAVSQQVSEINIF